MANQQKRLFAQGGMNKDHDLSVFPDGDYRDARNVVFAEGIQGEGGVFRKLEGFANIVLEDPQGHLTSDNKKIIDAVVDSEEKFIYYLLAASNRATIVQHEISSGINLTIVPSYQHEGCTLADASLTTIGDMLYWNWIGAGRPMSWYIPRTFDDLGVNDIDWLHLALIKEFNPEPLQLEWIPVGGSDLANPLFSRFNFQFAARWVYDSGEKSVLSPYTWVLHGFSERAGVTFLKLLPEDYTLKDYRGLSEIEIYAKNGNSGIWRRCITVQISVLGDPSTTDANGRYTTNKVDWFGELFEALETETGAKQFDFIPIESKSLEVADNRVFLGNNLNDYENPNWNDIVITIVDGGKLNQAVSPNPITYLDITSGQPGNNNVVPLLVDQMGETPYFKDANKTNHLWAYPFSNASTYAVGVAYFDEWGRTRGVEKHGRFTTGFFDYPIIPKVTVQVDTNNIPTWAKTFQLCYTKSLDKSYFLEGFCSYIFFVWEDSLGEQHFSFEAANYNINQIEWIVFDMMGMIKADWRYTYQEGDRIRIWLGGSADDFGDYLIVAAEGNFVYAEYNGKFKVPTTVDGLNYFEIYTPTKNIEESNLIFFPDGQARPVGLLNAGVVYDWNGTDGLVEGELLPVGDSIWKLFSVPVYVKSPTLTTSIDEQSTGQVKIAQNGGAVVIGATNAHTNPVKINYNKEEINEEGGALGGGGTFFKFSGDWDANSVTVYLDFILQVEVIDKLAGGDNVDMQVHVLKNDVIIETALLSLGSIFDGGGVGGVTNGDLIDFPDVRSITFEGVDTNIDWDLVLDDEISIAFESVVNNATFQFTWLTLNQGSFYDISALVTTTIFTTVYDPTVGVKGEFTDCYLRQPSRIQGYTSWDRSLGKPLLAANNDPAVRKESEIRYGGKYITGSKINDGNAFGFLNVKELPLENGSITKLYRASKLVEEGSIMLAVTNNETHSIYINEQIITDSQGNELIQASSSVIGTVRLLKGEMGCVHPQSFARYRGKVFFWDDLTKTVVRYDQNGLSPISDAGMKSYFHNKAGAAVGFFDPFYETYNLSFTGSAETLSFSIRSNRWMSFYDFEPIKGVYLNDQMYLFEGVAGAIDKMYRSLEPGVFNNYFTPGTSKICSLVGVVSDLSPLIIQTVGLRMSGEFKKTGQPNELATDIIEVNITNNEGQATRMKSTKFMVDKNMVYGHVLRDFNSAGGLIDGRLMEGYANEVSIVFGDAIETKQIGISIASVGFIVSAGHLV
jgi:hypothetical protein